jgi:hypothetical protein
MAAMKARQEHTCGQNAARTWGGDALLPRADVSRHSIAATILLALALIGFVSPPAALRAQATAPQPKSNQAAAVRATQLYAGMPLLFEANAGQNDARVRYAARADGFQVFLTDHDATLVRTNAAEGFALRMSWQDANANTSLAAEEQSRAKSNYFIGNDAAKWRTGIANYERVTYHSLYPGVDLVYYGNHERLEYDLRIAPGADASAIRLKMDGATQLRVDKDSGDLIAANGASEFRFLKPLIYQPDGANKLPVEGSYQLTANHSVIFSLGSYDHAKPLVIDPVVQPKIDSPFIAYSTVFGNPGAQFLGLAVDNQGYVYLSGTVNHIGLPTTAGVFQPTCAAMNATQCNNYFVAKFDTTKSGNASLVFSTFIGTNDTNDLWTALDESYSTSFYKANDLAVDSAGNTYFAGYAGASGYPTTSNAYSQSCTLDGGNCSAAAVLTKLSADGTQLLYSTYIPNKPGYDQVLPFYTGTLAVDANQIAYVAGNAYHGMPVTDNSSGAPQWDSPYVAAFDTTKSGAASRLWAEYLLMGTISTVAADTNGNLYVAGAQYGNLSNFPGSAQTPPINGFKTTTTNNYNAYLMKLDKTGKPVFSTYIGDGYVNQEFPWALATDPGGIVYVGGANDSQLDQVNGFPAYASYNRGGSYIAKIDTTQTGSASLLYSTYLFGNNASDQSLESLASNGTGIVAFSGTFEENASSPFAGLNPITQTPSVANGQPHNTYPAFVGLLDTNQTGNAALLMFSLLDGVQTPWTVSFDPSNADNLIVGGTAFTSTGLYPFQGTSASYETSVSGTSTPIFFYKIALAQPSYITITPSSLTFADQTVNSESKTQSVTVTNTGSAAVSINSITPSDGFTETDDCPASLAAGAHCTINVAFSPATVKSYNGTLTIADTDSGSPQTVALTGIGLPEVPDPVLDPTSYTFSDQPENSKSDPQPITLTNSGAAVLTNIVVSITGTNQAEFKQTNDCSAILQPGDHCTIKVVFQPDGIASYSASISVADNASGSPQTAAVSGNGVAPPVYIPLSISESIHISDAEALTPSVALSIKETIHTSDVPALTIISVPLIINEAIRVSDSESAQIPLSIPLTIAETIHVSDAASLPLSTVLSIVESIHITDNSVAAAPEPTRTVLSVSSQSLVPGQSVTMTATVGSAGSGTPTGTVSFYDGSMLLGKGDLKNNKAIYSTVFPASSQHLLTAVYGGDNDDQGSSSTPVAVTVLPLDFTLAPIGADRLNVIPGGTGVFELSVTPLYGCTATATTFSVSGLPAGATATFNPPAIPAGCGAQTVTLSIHTASSTAVQKKQEAPGRRYAPVALALLILQLAGLRRIRRMGHRMTLALLLVVGLSIGAICGCGLNSGFFAQSPVTYTITVTASGDGVQHAIPLTLEVQ